MLHSSADGDGDDGQQDEALMAEITSTIEGCSGLSPTALFNPVIPEDAEFCAQDAAAIVGLEVWRFRRAVRLGLIEDSDNYRWPKSLLMHVFANRRSISRAVKRFRPRGAHKCADYLRDHSDLDVSVTDIHELIRRYRLRPVGIFGDWPLYDPNDIDELIEEEGEMLESIVSKRIEWEDATVDIRDLAAYCGVLPNLLRSIARRCDIPYEPEWGFYERVPIWAIDILVAEAANGGEPEARHA